MKRLLLIAIMLFITNAFAQQTHAWVYFNDKPVEDVDAFMANPLSALTQRSLDRRTRQGIDLDETDVPIRQEYIDQVESSTGITVKAKSKWMNAVHVLGLPSAINALEDNLPSIIDSIDFAANNLNAKPNNNINPKNKFVNENIQTKINYNYGGSLNQANQIRVDYLHELDFTGEGMMIAVMDNGFPGVNTFSGFAYLRDNNKILDGSYNFIDRNENIYSRGAHGVSVLSTIGGFVDGQLVGTAIDAEYLLFITEDNQSETPVEESYWVEAAELADYYGVDVINTSLGYSTFVDDDYDYDYSPSDMDGDTTFITRGADIAASKGMIVCNSAGNSGGSSWNIITAPADGHNVFTVGAVDANGNIAGFSSYGPTAPPNQRIKPDVLAKGSGTTIINGVGNVSTGSGTSFSSPVMTGAVASFWQAFPDKTNFEIMDMIRESASLYDNPTDHGGYGIPNFEDASISLSVDDLGLSEVVIYPNPVQNRINFELATDFNNFSVGIFDILGKQVLSSSINITNNTIEINALQKGIYLVQLENKEGSSRTFKIIKK